MMVDPNDETFWGPGGKATFLERIKATAKDGIEKLAEIHGWELDGNGNPLPPWQVFSVSEMAKNGHGLMAHVMHQAGAFESVSDARKNGWNKPIAVGEYIIKKKRKRIRVVE